MLNSTNHDVLLDELQSPIGRIAMFKWTNHDVRLDKLRCLFGPITMFFYNISKSYWNRCNTFRATRVGRVPLSASLIYYKMKIRTLFSALLFTIAFCSKRPADFSSDHPNKSIRLLEEEETYTESPIELIKNILRIPTITTGFAAEMEKLDKFEITKAFHLSDIFKSVPLRLAWISLVMNKQWTVVKTDEFTKYLPTLIQNDLFALLLPWNSIIKCGFGISHYAFSTLSESFIQNFALFNNDDPHTKYRSVKGAFHSLYSMIMMSEDLNMIKNHISPQLYEFLLKHSYLHPSLSSSNIILNNWTDECKKDILQLKNLFDLYIARAFAIQHDISSRLPSVPIECPRNFQGTSLRTDSSFLILALPEDMRILYHENLFQLPDILALHRSIPLSIYSTSDEKDDYIDSPFFWEVVECIRKTKFRISEISVNLIPAFRYVTPQIVEMDLDIDLSTLIPQLPDNFFKINDIRTMCPSNIGSLSVAQVKVFRSCNVGNLDWSCFNDEVKQFIRNSDFRINLLKSESKVSPTNSSFFDDLSILPEIEADLRTFIVLHKQMAHLPAHLVEEIKICQMSHGDWEQLAILIESGELNNINWKDNVKRLREYFNSVDLTLEAQFEWDEPVVPVEFDEFNIEKIYNFETLFEGVPKGLWMVFFGFIQMEDTLWGRLFENFPHELVLRLAFDPIFSLICPWSRLAQSSPATLATTRGLLLDAFKSNSGQLLGLFIFLHFEYFQNPSCFDSRGCDRRMFDLWNDWNGIPDISDNFYQKMKKFASDKKNISTMIFWAYLLKEHYFVSAEKSPRPLSEIYYRCGHGAALMFVSLFSNNVEWEPRYTLKDMSVSFKFWESIAQDNIGQSMVKSIERFNLTDMIRKILELDGKAKPDFIEDFAIPLFRDLSFPLRWDTITIRSPAAVRALSASFFLRNQDRTIHFTEEATNALQVKQIRALRNNLPGLNWNLLDSETRQALLEDKQLLIKCFGKARLMNLQNWDLFTVESFGNLIASSRLDNIADIVKSLDSFPQNLRNEIVKFLAKDVNRFRLRILKDVKNIPPAIFALLTEPEEDEELERTWNKKWSKTMLINAANQNVEGLSPRSQLMIRKFILSEKDNLTCFLRQSWNQTILTEIEWQKIKMEDLESLIQSTKRSKDSCKRNLVSNFVRYFYMMPDDMKVKAVEFIVRSMCKLNINEHLEREHWSLLPNLIEAKLGFSGAPGFVAKNFNIMTLSQKQQIEEYLLKRVGRLALWFNQSLLVGRCLILSEEFWSNMSGFKLIDKFLHSGKNTIQSKLSLVTGIAINWAKLTMPLRAFLIKLSNSNWWALLCLLKSPESIIFDQDFWNSFSEESFRGLVEVFRRKDGNMLKRMEYLIVQRSIQRNMPYMTADQLAALLEFELTNWINRFNATADLEKKE